LKIDGFRELVHISHGKGELVSRNGNVFRGFAELASWIAAHLKVEDAVLDGEIACIDGDGRPIFKDLLFRKSTCVFVAFDLLSLNGKDLRTLPLIERKQQLRKLLRNGHESCTSITSRTTASCCSSKSSKWTWKEWSASGRTRLTA
jgi:bifunctional non-homologous end joining protein LigD